MPSSFVLECVWPLPVVASTVSDIIGLAQTMQGLDPATDIYSAMEMCIRDSPCAAHVLYYSNVYVEETGGFDDVCRQRHDVSRRTIPKKIKGGLRPASGRSEV